MLLMVGCQKDFHVIGSVFEAYRLDTSTKLAKWVKVERLEKWAIFISNDSESSATTVDEPREVGEGGATVYTAMILVLAIWLHLSWASHCMEMMPPNLMSSVSHVTAAWCNLYGLSPVCSLCAVMANDFQCNNLPLVFFLV